jgi:hypothetical protein
MSSVSFTSNDGIQFPFALTVSAVQYCIAKSMMYLRASLFSYSTIPYLSAPTAHYSALLLVVKS